MKTKPGGRSGKGNKRSMGTIKRTSHSVHLAPSTSPPAPHLALRTPHLAPRTKLVSRIRDSLTKSGHLGQDLISRFRPHEGLRRFVGNREVLANGGLEGADTAMS